MTATRAEHARRRKVAASRFCVKGHPRLLENLLVLSRAEDGHPDRETCRPCWQLSHRCAAGPYIDRSAATKAIVTAWT